MGKLGKLNIVIGAINNTQRAFKNINRGLATISARTAFIRKQFRNLSIAIAAAGAAFAILGKKSFESVDNLGKTATNAGLAVETLQALQLGAVEAGSSQEGLNKAMEKFAKNIGDVTAGIGQAKPFLDKMGISIRDNNGEIKSQDVLLREVVAGIQNLGDSSAKAATLQALFGREGIKLTGILGQGLQTVDAFAEKARRLGKDLSGGQVRAVESFNDSFARLGTVVSSLRDHVFASLAPVFETITEGLTNMLVRAADLAGGFRQLGVTIANSIMSGAIKALEGIKFLAEGLDFIGNLIGFETSDKVQKLIDKLESLKMKVGEIPEEFNKVGTELDVTPIENATTKIQGAFKQVLEIMNKNLNDTSKSFTSIATTIENELVTAFMNIHKGMQSLGDAIKNIAQAVIQELIRIFIVKKMVGAITGAVTGGTQPAGFARGGTVTGGKAVIVGEKGAELFVPNRTGTIVPNNQLAASNGMAAPVNVSFNISAMDAEGLDKLLVKKKNLLVSVVSQAMNQRGKVGLV